MLRDKIDYAKFLTWFIENYPQSARQTRENQEKWHSGHNSNNSPYSIRQQNSCLIFFLASPCFSLFSPFCFFSFALAFSPCCFPPHCLPLACIFFESSFSTTQKKDTSYHLPPNFLIINICPPLACIF